MLEHVTDDTAHHIEDRTVKRLHVSGVQYNLASEQYQVGLKARKTIQLRFMITLVCQAYNYSYVIKQCLNTIYICGIGSTMFYIIAYIIYT